MAGQNEWNGKYYCWTMNDRTIMYFLESLFGCFDDCETCLCGYFCLPCLFGQNAEKIDNSSCCGMCCVYTILTSCYLCWLPHYFKRENLRRKYNLREDPCNDLPTALCCGPCAICQEARFLKRRGIFLNKQIAIINFISVFLQLHNRVLL